MLRRNNSNKVIKHYAPSEWADFVRGLVSGADHEQMQQHLDGGCPECHQIEDLLARFAACAAVEAQYEPPAYALHYARSIYRLQQPEEVRILPRIIAKVVYDSFRAPPLLAGVRGQQEMTRQVLYRAGNYYLDFRLEHKQGSSEMSLVGQITDRHHPEGGVADIPVQLLSHNSVVAEARSNQFGEFQMRYRPAPSLRLYAPVQAGTEGIEIRLDKILSPHKEQ
jgi:hypothetical protein